MTLVHLTAGKEILHTTVDHPFYVKGKGFLPAAELTVGDILLDSHGEELPVENVEVELQKEPIAVYNFQVEDFHTYHVGRHGVLVHNAEYGGESGSDIFDKVKRIDEIEVEFNYSSKYGETEFARQLAEQQKGMNELTVQEYLDNRQRYIEQGRAIKCNATQRAAREKAFVDKVDEQIQKMVGSMFEAEENSIYLNISLIYKD